MSFKNAANIFSIITSKLQEQGAPWVLRRIVREFINPTTHYGKFLKILASPVYYLISKPLNRIVSPTEISNTTDTLYYFYDLDVEPITFDFAWALCIANAKRIELGLKKIHIVIVPGRVNGLRKETPEYEKVLNQEARRWRIFSIIIPIIHALDAPHGFTYCGSRYEAQTTFLNKAKHVFPLKYNLTFPIPYDPNMAQNLPAHLKALRADPQAIQYITDYFSPLARGKKIIAITLRNYDYHPSRNNNIIEWLKFAGALDKHEYFVTFIPDTEDALSQETLDLDGWHTFNLAASNALLRHALYEIAYLNLSVNTGPFSLCWLNPNCHYITFKIIPESLHFKEQLGKIMQARGFVNNENAFFANKLQKWVWKEDTFDVILSEFELMCHLIEKEHSKKPVSEGKHHHAYTL